MLPRGPEQCIVAIAFLTALVAVHFGIALGPRTFPPLPHDSSAASSLSQADRSLATSYRLGHILPRPPLWNPYDGIGSPVVALAREGACAPLSAVARAVTGQRWNGLLFFGLTSRKRRS